MLGKRDPIFWAATFIFVVALVLMVAVDESWILLMLASYLLRPTLHSVGLAPKLIDERQLAIQYRASSLALAVIMLGNVIVTLVLMRRGDHTWEMVLAVLLAAITARALGGLLLVGDSVGAGKRILVSIGVLAALFEALDAGVPWGFVAVLPGAALAALGFYARRQPRIVASVVAVLIVALIAAYAVSMLRSDGRALWGRALAGLFLITALAAAAIALWRSKGAGTEEAQQTLSGEQVSP